MEIGQYVQIFLDIFNLNVYKYPPNCLSNNINKATGCNSVLIEPLLITQLIKSQFSDLSSAQKIWELFFFLIQHVHIRLEHISKQLYQQNAITTYFWCIINYPIN